MEVTHKDPFIGKTIYKSYLIKKKLGEGSFGKVYVIANVKTNELFAAKFVSFFYLNFQEKRDNKNELLDIEARILHHIKAFGLPEIIAFKSAKDYNILIMELLGQSLETLFQSQEKKFSLKTVCMIGIQILDRIEYVHSRKIIHRDIKPDNFSIGKKNKSHIIYILDFGLAKKYWSTTHNSHIPYIEGKKLTGTARYASINALGGCEQSRRDDLESIFYILIYFIKGRLPWQGLKADKKEDRYKKIYEIKKNIKIKELCSELPEEFESFYNYIRKLEFEQVPDYDYLKLLLKNILEKNNFIIDYYYDWDKVKPNIPKNDNIFKNNYNIKYNGKEKWLIRSKDSKDEYNLNKNENIYNYTIKNNKIINNVYSKPVLSLNKNYKIGKSNSKININSSQPSRTADNSVNDSKQYESNYTKSKKYRWK